jgi:prepilin-type N-terminal cleavage/methylation domain-containing protein
MIGSFTRKTAWNRLMKKLKAKAAQSSGFTLIEVIFAIIVLSIVSITLLEMFTVSTKTNAAAGVLDKARSLCVEASEEFRANPVGPDPLDLSDRGESAYLGGFEPSTGESGEIIYTKYYDRHWAETDDESKAEYFLEIIVTKTELDPIPVSYYPESAVSLSGRPGAVTVSSGTTVRLEKADESGCRLVIEPNSYEILQDKIMYSDASVAAARTAMIPIHLDCSGIDANTEITVINEAGSLTKDGDDAEYEAIADIYLCDVDEGVKVTVYTVKGVATSNSVSTREQKITRYIADISVKEKNSGRIIARTTVETSMVRN